MCRQVAERVIVWARETDGLSSPTDEACKMRTSDVAAFRMVYKALDPSLKALIPKPSPSHLQDVEGGIERSASRPPRIQRVGIKQGGKVRRHLR